MPREEYRNIPTDYVVKRALGWLLVVIGWIGVILGMCIHYFGAEEGLYWGANFLSIFIVFDIRAIERTNPRRAAVAICLAAALLSMVGVIRLHQYYLLFGVSLLFGIAILLTIRRKPAAPAEGAGNANSDSGRS